MQSSFVVSSDIGGTFTDTTVMEQGGQVTRYKAPSTPDQPVDGIFETFRLAATNVGLDLEGFINQIQHFSNGTTIATNALLQRAGAVTALIQTRGFGDTLYIQRGYKGTGLASADVRNYPALKKPRPVIPRTLIREVNERIDYQGRVITTLDEEDARRVVRELLDDGVESFAVSLLWSFLNPVHEQRLARIISEEAPDAFVSLSHELLPRMGELARTTTTAVNAFIGPQVKTAMDALQSRMGDQGLMKPPLIMQSSGGLAEPGETTHKGVSILMSGPVGGVVGSQRLGGSLGFENVITADMGGTSFDVGLVVDGEPVITNTTLVDRQIIGMPAVAVETIGAGGGSIASVSNGVLKVGPASAGAVPGPVCYGRGGAEPTVTDADIVLGLVNPENFLGGRMTLDKEAASRAIEEKIAGPLGLSVHEAAEGIKTIVDNHMADLIRRLTVERGYDPREFVLFAYGGAGGVHAHRFGAELGVQRIVVPATASVHSAFGILTSDLVMTHEVSGALVSPPSVSQHSEYISFTDINDRFANVSDVVRRGLQRQGVEDSEVDLEYWVDMRFRQQIHEISVRVPGIPMSADGDVDDLVDEFTRVYEARMGEGSAFPETGVEIVGFRGIGKGRVQRPEVSTLTRASNGSTEARKGSRDIFEGGRWIEAGVYDGTALGSGDSFDGPAIFELPDTTIVVGEGQKVSVDELGNLVIAID